MLLGIFLTAAVLRLWDLSSYPAGFTPDEASFGYDAYSILKTGKDQWGESFPLAFRSFGDFKAPLYTYLTVPSVAVFGLNEFAVRLPNAILGILTVFVVYLLSLELLKTQKDHMVYAIQHLPLIAAFLLAISPWHMSLSRGAFEANLTTFLMPLGTLAFLKGIKDWRWMVASTLIFGLNLFSYHSAKLITPLIVIYLFLWKRREIIWEKSLNIASLVFLFFVVVSFSTMFFGSGKRVGDVGIFNPTGGWGAVSDRRYEAVGEGLPDTFSRLFSNKITYTGSEFFKNYLSYLSPTFLFTQGAGEATYGMIPGHGVLYLFEIPFLLVVLWTTARKPFEVKWLLLVIVWCILSPIPASLAKGPGFAANRIAVMIPVIQILSAYGAIIVWGYLRRKKLWMYSYIVFSIVGILFFLEAYFFHGPRVNGPSMSYGWRDTMGHVRSVEKEYDHIVISRALSEPHIFVAFYNRWDPRDYQEESQNWLRYEKQGLPFVDQLGEWKLGKYVFRDIRYSEDSSLKDTLIVGRARDFPEKVKEAKKVNYPDGKPAFVVVSNAKND